MSDRDQRLVWIDLEMTGLDADRCSILEIATLVTDDQLEIVAEGPNLIIQHDEDALLSLSDWSREHFTKSGLLERCKASGITHAEAERQTLEFLRQHVPEGKSPLCGNSVHNDRAFLLTGMRTLHDFLHYRNVDVSTLKELVKRWHPDGPPPPAKQELHEALADIRESVAELRFYRETYFRSP